MTANEIITIILDEAFRIHKELGPGLLENVYKKCLIYRLSMRGLFVEEEKPVTVFFEEVRMECGYRTDIVVEKLVVVETKCIESINELEIAQVLTCLRFLNLRLGVILNLNTTLMKNGIRRVVLGYLMSENVVNAVLRCVRCDLA